MRVLFDTDRSAARTEFIVELIPGLCYIIDTKEETTAHKVVDLR